MIKLKWKDDKHNKEARKIVKQELDDLDYKFNKMATRAFELWNVLSINCAPSILEVPEINAVDNIDDCPVYISFNWNYFGTPQFDCIINETEYNFGYDWGKQEWKVKNIHNIPNEIWEILKTYFC